MVMINEWWRLWVVMPLAERIKGTCSVRWLKQIERMSAWTPMQVHQWQEEKLHAMIDHAYYHTAYYRRVMDERGLKPDDIKTIEDLQKLPVITKQIVNEHFNEIVPDNISSYKYRAGKTGGTTGEPMFYYCDENTWGYVTAAKMYYWRKYGYCFGEPFAALGGASLFAEKPSLTRRIYDIIRNEIPMNGVNLTDEICEKYIRIIRTKKIRYLYGYAAAIHIFTCYVSKHHVDLKQIQGVFTTAENLTDDNRRLIEETYACNVWDCYGARDAGITAYEIAYHQYAVGYNVIAEVMNPIGANTGTLLSTNFLNLAFPLIRYQFGDEAELIDRDEVQGYNGQMLKQVLGRTANVMRLENGHNMTATGFSMILKEFDIRAFTFNKTGTNEVTLIIEPIQGKYNESQEQEIRRAIYLYVGKDATLKIEYVAEFTPLANGKRRYFMTNTNEPE